MDASLTFWIVSALLMVGLAYAGWVALVNAWAFVGRHFTVCQKPRPLPWEERLDCLAANPWRRG